MQFNVSVKFAGGETVGQIVDQDELKIQLAGLAESNWGSGDSVTVICVG